MTAGMLCFPAGGRHTALDPSSLNLPASATATRNRTRNIESSPQRSGLARLHDARRIEPLRTFRLNLSKAAFDLQVGRGHPLRIDGDLTPPANL